MHFSCVLALSSVKVTCSVGSLRHIRSSLKAAALSPEASTSRVTPDVCAGGGLPASGDLASADPASAALSAPSHGYNTVWELLAITFGSLNTSDGESRDTTEDERRESAQRKRPPPPPPRPRAPISQNSHLIFSISFRTTVLLSRM